MHTKAQLLKTLIREEIEHQLREIDAESPESGIDASQPVDMVISKIKKGPVMSSISKISNDTQKAQLIMKFAELVGVPKNKLPMLLQTVRKTAQ